MPSYVYLIIMVVMMCCSAFFSGSEIAFNASNKLRLRRAAEEGESTAKLALRMSENFATSLAAILVGNNIANIAISTCMTLLMMDWFSGNEGLASTIATAVVTVLLLIFGEIVPKILSKQHADKLVRVVAFPIRVITIALMPLIAIALLVVKVLSFIWGKDKTDDEPTVTEEELSTIIETVEEEGIIDEDQGELLQSTLDFRDTNIEAIMTPRIDVVALDIDADEEEFRELVSDAAQYSRIPVYEDSIDNIIGVLSLTRYYKKQLDVEEPDIRSLLLKPCKLHKTMKLPAALARMREQKIHLAIVIDEFGGTLGIVTMEDILEELVGEIWDDTDIVITECRQTGENTYEVVGDMNIEDCFDEIEFEAPESFACEYSTMGGWAIEMLEANPHVGDSFAYENLFVVVVEMEEERVTRLTVLVTPREDEEEE